MKAKKKPARTITSIAHMYEKLWRQNGCFPSDVWQFISLAIKHDRRNRRRIGCKECGK